MGVYWATRDVDSSMSGFSKATARWKGWKRGTHPHSYSIPHSQSSCKRGERNLAFCPVAEGTWRSPLPFTGTSQAGRPGKGSLIGNIFMVALEVEDRTDTPGIMLNLPAFSPPLAVAGKAIRSAAFKIPWKVLALVHFLGYMQAAHYSLQQPSPFRSQAF